MWVLIGIPIVVIGFALRFNPLLVVTVAGISTGIAGGMHTVDIISAFGKAFTDNRYMGLVWLTLPVIALLERSGLREQAKHLISKIHAATTGRVLMLYFFIRQMTAALGLTSLGGHAQMVRPLIAPMAEAAATTKYGDLPNDVRQKIRANAAAVDNIAVFFGEDIFIAVQSILLIKGFLDQNGVFVEPLHLSVWAIPTAIAALIIHFIRLWLLDRSLAKRFDVQQGSLGK
ncbi:DUF969 domain-containing protein [Rouxiella badensis]|jgi:uncharacterized membrane protein|uniref:DUF969 domain-containing protein n=1 Tax=Rouxiella badensis TaxID=1646377 RepID=A0A1X0WFY7_9GAMM|nr:DUF969 domain-containing protein [Rouxiella badensis]MCC3704433.1 DUF969 domain-containing protein [Rouxiella badensis]MCC3718530.1 DUF969 domain-containing protein [Rouxiella badensis]MCC3726702.1 DUF969 domain-containing protein [Rouxiella badensis]MCC3735346.1 DUF969 domain-containing protein [Rouxiella badensis]MCC3738948.1 DUF969 domain-containing protein [Rouxiella badensis]